MSIGTDTPAPERASGAFLDARGAFRLGPRHAPRHLGEPRLPHPRLQREPGSRRHRPRHPLRRLDPVDDPAPLGGAVAPLPRPDPDPRAPLRRVPGRRGAAGRLPGGDRRRLDLPPRRRGPHRRGERRAPARGVRRRQGLLHRRQGRPRHHLLDHRERRRRLQLPLRPPDHAGRGRCSAWSSSPSRSTPTRRAGGGRGSRSWSPTATTRCCSPPSPTGGSRRCRTSSPPAPTPRGSAGRCARRGRASAPPPTSTSPAPRTCRSRCRSASATGGSPTSPRSRTCGRG